MTSIDRNGIRLYPHPPPFSEGGAIVAPPPFDSPATSFQLGRRP